MSKESIGIGMEFFKGKLSFVEHNITRYINTPHRHIKTLDVFVLCTVTEEHILFGMKHEFVRIIGAKIRPTCTAKNTKSSVVRCDMQETFGGGFILDDTTRPHINEMDSGKKCFISKFEWHKGRSEKG